VSLALRLAKDVGLLSGLSGNVPLAFCCKPISN